MKNTSLANIMSRKMFDASIIKINVKKRKTMQATERAVLTNDQMSRC